MALLTGERVASGRCVIDSDGYQVTKGSPATAGGIANTLTGFLTNAAPAANQVQAVITAPPAGVYDVTVFVAITGTAETTLMNMRVRENTNEITQLPTLTGLPTTMRFPRVTVSGGNLDIQVKGVAPVAGAIYTTHIIATRLS